MKTLDFLLKEIFRFVLFFFSLFFVTQVGYSQTCGDNILMNGDASLGLTGWTITAQSGDGWSSNGRFFRTSYGSCPELTATHRKHQVVDLVAAGYDPDYLDSQPAIEVGEMVISPALNALCGTNGLDNYYVRYELRDASQNVLASHISGTPSNPNKVSRNFIEEHATFINYGTGARYLYFEHGGSDSNFWAGWFGSYFTDGYVRVADECSATVSCPGDVVVTSLDDYVGAPATSAPDASDCCYLKVSYSDTQIGGSACSPVIEREWQARTKAPINDLSCELGAIAGIYSGEVSEFGLTYTTTTKISCNGVTVDYSIGCGGQWVYNGFNGISYLFREIITSGGGCVIFGNIEITPQANGDILYQYFYIGASTPQLSSILNKQSGPLFSEKTSFCRQKIEVIFNCGITCPPDTCVNLGDDISPAILGQARSNADCDLSLLSYTDYDQSECEGVTQMLRTWKANFGSSDCSRSCSQIISFDDSAAPDLYECPEDIVVVSSCQDVHWQEPIAIDNCIRVALTSNYSPGTTFAHGNTEVIYSAFDACGNTTSCSFNVMVENEMAADCPGDLVMDYSEQGVNWTAPAYSGTCDDCLSAGHISGYKYVGSYGGSAYYLSRSTSDYATAQANAAAAGGYLASISSREEDRFLSSKVHLTAFIGLSNFDSSGDYNWDSGEQSSYSNWFVNQPNNLYGEQNYVELLSIGQWNDTEDKSSYSIIEVACTNSSVNQISGPIPGTHLLPGTYDITYTIEDGCGYSACCSFTLTIEEPIQGYISNPDPVQATIEMETTYSETTDSDQVNPQSIEIETVDLIKESLPESLTALQVYPNPVSDELNIVGLSSQSYVIYDQNGRDVITKSYHTTVNVSPLNSGIYILRTSDGKLFRFVKL